MEKDIDYFIQKCEKLQNNDYIKDDDAFESFLILRLLKELKERREKDCNCELISARNEVIKSGFICIHCGKTYAEYTGGKIDIRHQKDI